MFRDLPAYAEMRESGLPWAAEIPRHWEVKRAKAIMRAVDIRSSSGEEDLLTVSSSRGVIPRSAAKVSMFKAESYVGHKLCWPDDLVINSLWAWGCGLGVAQHHGIVSTAYGVYRQRGADLDASYLHELVRSDRYQWELQVRSQGVWKSRLQMTDDRWLDAPLLVPSADEQAAIVKYLDHANARIDRVIFAKRRLIALLDEQTRASNLKILESHSKRWPQRRLKWVARLQRGYDLPADRRQPGRFPVISSGGIIATHQESRVVGPGVIIGRYGSTDAVFYVHDDFWPHNTALFVTDFQGNDPRWCYWLLRSMDKTTYAEKSAIPGIDRKDLYQIEVSVPPIAVQREMVQAIERISLRQDSVRARVGRELSLLQEFRTRLVADAVTGQVDVRGFAATLPDAPELFDELAPILDDELEEALSENRGE